MTTESLSPESRIVIETSSRPAGDRSTSISLTGGAADACAVAGALARGATAPAAAATSKSPNDGPAAAEAVGDVPNTLPCGADCPAEAAGSGALPSAALSLGSALAEGAAGLATRGAEGAAAASAFRPPRTGSCAAARIGLPVGLADGPAPR